MSGCTSAAERVDMTAGGVVDVQGVCKCTVVRGEGGFPGDTLRVSDCHDTVVYALAPLQVPPAAAAASTSMCIHIGHVFLDSCAGNAPLQY